MSERVGTIKPVAVDCHACGSRAGQPCTEQGWSSQPYRGARLRIWVSWFHPAREERARFVDSLTPKQADLVDRTRMPEDEYQSLIEEVGKHDRRSFA
jgi:hypothetical protein